MDETVQKISIIIVTFNSSRTLGACLTAAAAQDYPDYEVVVYDNLSSDESCEIARSFEGVTLIEADANSGFAGGVNAAVRACKGELIAVLNPDAIPAQSWLTTLAATLESFPKAAGVCSRQLQSGDQSRIDGASDCLHISGYAYRAGTGRPASHPSVMRKGRVFSASGAASLFDRYVWEEAGGYDESYFCYWEDMDLCARMHWLGYDIIYDPDAVVVHEGYSTSDGPHKKFVATHSFRNQIRTLVKIIPYRIWPLVLPGYVLVTLIHVLGGTIRGRKSGWYKLTGIWQGLKCLPEDMRWHRAMRRRRRLPIWRFLVRLSWQPFAVFTRSPKIRG